MSLMPGARLGRYEIVGLVGAGAMGEVYRARDPQLGRDVAIKVLGPAFTDDGDRLTRFEQEARAAAALNHPNILAVFDIGRDHGSPYIVSEFLEGGTLRERLKAGALPGRKAVEYASQIAHGLAAAHEKGIVHRDLKPDNVFVTSDGRVKILDFGLAKLTEPPQVASVGSVVPTNPPGTQPGMVLGTLGYMSPEQVRGLPADYRSDIFSFGAILYEMLLGRPAFQRDTPADTMSAILKEHPFDISSKEHHIPPLVARIVERCLEKSAAMRFQSTEDLAFALVGALSADSEIHSMEHGLPAAPGEGGSPWTWGIVGAVAALIVAATIAAGLLPRTPALSEVAVKLNVPLPPTVVQIDPTVKISPDGLRVVFAAQTSEGLRRLWVRALDSLDAYPLMETDGATQPFWSADGRALGFFVSGQLKRIDVMGGTVATICPALQANGGTWNADDVIVFSSQGELRRVAATGGTVTTLKGANGARDGASLTYPSFLPDGQHLLYLDTGSGGKDEAAVYAAALNAADRTLVLPAAKSNALYSDGYLFYLRDTTLVAQPFDTGRLKLGGDAVAIAEEVQRTPNVPGGAFSISDRVLAYRAGALARGLPTQLQLFDRTGKVLGTVGDRADYADVELSPDGTHAAVSVLNPGTGRDIWIFDIARGIPTRFTSDPADEYGSVWSPDGTQIIFTSRTKGHFDLYQKAASGAGAEQELLEDKFDKWPMSWSSDGKTLIYSTGRISSVGVVPQLWGVNLVGTRVPFQALDDSQFTQFPGKLSPDGHWLAYTSNESGQSEIYVVSFPSRNIKLRVSTAGGSWPRWSHNGKELFFIADNTKMMSAEVTTDGSKLSIGTVRMLFEARWPQGARYVYDVAPNGNIFGAIRLEPPAASPITLVVNWRSDLKK